MEEIDFAALVKRIREGRGLTQEELARELDVTVGSVNGWENGRHRPVRAQRKRLRRMAEAHSIEVPIVEQADPAGQADAAGGGAE